MSKFHRNPPTIFCAQSAYLRSLSISINSITLPVCFEKEVSFFYAKLQNEIIVINNIWSISQWKWKWRLQHLLRKWSALKALQVQWVANSDWTQWSDFMNKLIKIFLKNYNLKYFGHFLLPKFKVGAGKSSASCREKFSVSNL